MQAGIELVEGEVQLDIFRQQPHHLALKLAPGRLNSGQTLKRFLARWRLEDRMCVGCELHSSSPSRLLKGQGFLADWIGLVEITITEVSLQTTDFMHRTALLLCGGQVFTQRSG